VKFTREGEIPGVKVGLEWKFSESALNKYKESGENPDSSGLVKKKRSIEEYYSSLKPDKRKSKIPSQPKNSLNKKPYPSNHPSKYVNPIHWKNA
jgi:hypothetical protein